MISNNDRSVNRWYIVTYSGNHSTANQRLNAVKGLKFYAPLFFEEEKRFNRRETWVFRNYAFIFSSQNEIYKLKKCELPNFNFMPSTDKVEVHHPFVTNDEIEQLRKVEKMNDGKIPLALTTEDILLGDKVEILTGEFNGYTARAITKNGSKYRRIYLSIGKQFMVPLCRLTKEQFRIISFADSNKKAIDISINGEEAAFISEAAKWHYGLTTIDKETAESYRSRLEVILAKWNNVNSASANTRLRVHAIKAVIYAILGAEDKSLHNLKLAKSLPMKKISRNAKLMYLALRYVSTAYIDHYLEFKELNETCTQITSKSLTAFIKLAHLVSEYQIKKSSQKTPLGFFRGIQGHEYWFCISAPKKKTEALKAFREADIAIYAPVVSEGSTPSREAKKNLFKDLFFVRMTFDALVAFREDKKYFSVLTQLVDDSEQVITYTNDDIETFEYICNLDLPNKEIIQFSSQHEQIILKSQRKTITLGERAIEGIIMSTRKGQKTQEKVLIPLRGIATIAITTDE